MEKKTKWDVLSEIAALIEKTDEGDSFKRGCLRELYKTTLAAADTGEVEPPQNK